MAFDIPLNIEAEVCIPDNKSLRFPIVLPLLKAKGSSPWYIFPILCGRPGSMPLVSFAANFVNKDESMKTGISGVKRR
jgi:hypothetical protein